MKDRLLTILLSDTSTCGVMQAVPKRPAIREVDRLIVKKELIVSDTGQPWEKGFEAQQFPRGIYARSLGEGPGGQWVHSRLIMGDIDDRFDDRFHALEKDGSLHRAAGHISWNVWIDGAWRQTVAMLSSSSSTARRWPFLCIECSRKEWTDKSVE